MKHRTDYPEIDYKTRQQWLKLGFYPNQDAEGTTLWCNPHHQNLAVYYVKEEVHPITKEELEEVRATAREKNRVYKERYRKRQEESLKEKLLRAEEKGKRSGLSETDALRRRSLYSIKEMLRHVVSISDMVPVENKTGMVVLDVETTGFHPEYGNEVLQVSIIDGTGKVLMNTYVRPYLEVAWDDAEQVHGISPDKVKDAPYLHEVIGQIKSILSSTEMIVGYNISFDLDFLREWGLFFEGKKN